MKLNVRLLVYNHLLTYIFSALEKSADTLEIELNDYQNKLDALSNEIDVISRQLAQRADYHATCDA